MPEPADDAFMLTFYANTPGDNLHLDRDARAVMRRAAREIESLRRERDGLADEVDSLRRQLARATEVIPVALRPAPRPIRTRQRPR